MGKIVLSDKIKFKLVELSEILFEKGFFGYKKSADEYVNRIRDFIQTIPNQPLKLCKSTKFGKYYVRYDNPTSNMKYFITFNKFENDYFI